MTHNETTPLPPEPYPDTPFVEPYFGPPVNAAEQINKYGTYEVQDTTDTDNVFPCIGPDGSSEACLELTDAVLDKQRPHTGYIG